MKQFIFSIVLVFCFIDVYSQEIVWQRIYNDSLTEYPQAIKQTRDSSYIICGYQKVLGANNFDAWLMKINENGEIIWSKRYGDSITHDYIWDFCINEDNRIIACGTKKVSDLYELWLLVIDSTGNVIWDSTYSNIYGNEPKPKKIILDETNNIIIAGSFNFDWLYNKAFIAKFNQIGDLLWLRKYSLEENGIVTCSDILEIPVKSNYVICCWSMVFNAPDNGWIRWHDSLGNIINTLGFGEFFYPHNIVLSNDSFYIVNGENGIMKTSNTELCWINSDYNTYERDLYATNNFEYIAVGNTPSHKMIDSISVVKFDSDGNIFYVLSHSFSSGIFQQATSICESHENGYLVIGEININGRQAFIIKYMDPVGVEEIELIHDDNIISNLKYIIENFGISIEFILERNEEISIEFYDVTGRQVLSMPHKIYFQGANRISIELKKKGIYFILFEFTNIKYYKKLLIT